MEDQNNVTTGVKRGSRRTSPTSTTAAPGMANDTPSPWSRDEDSEQSRGFMGRVKERASAQLNTQKDRATDGIGSAVQAVRQSTQQLRDQKHDTVAQYIEQAADQLDRFANRIKEKNVNELLDDAQRFARRQPALFIGGALALGLLGSRFFKSSSPDRGSSGTYSGNFYRSGESGGSSYQGAIGTTGSGSAFGRADTSGPGGGTGSSGTIAGTPRDLPGTETY
jgi:hypothetical protein